MLKIRKKGQDAKHHQEQGIVTILNSVTGALSTYRKQFTIAVSIVAAYNGMAKETMPSAIQFNRFMFAQPNGKTMQHLAKRCGWTWMKTGTFPLFLQREIYMETSLFLLLLRPYLSLRLGMDIGSFM